MDAAERERLRLVTNRLATRLGIDGPPEPQRARQPELMRVFQLRAHADFLEALDGAIKDEGYSAAAGESRADMEAADAAADADAASAAADTGKAAKATAPVTKKGKA
jgi:hypothetical protein